MLEAAALLLRTAEMIYLGVHLASDAYAFAEPVDGSSEPPQSLLSSNGGSSGAGDDDTGSVSDFFYGGSRGIKGGGHGGDHGKMYRMVVLAVGPWCAYLFFF